MASQAVFLDRDGVINELVYYEDQGIIDSPFTPAQFVLIEGVGDAIRQLREAGYMVVLVSNQPGTAKGHMSEAAFTGIREKMISELARYGAVLDGEYYCRHHPEARVAGLRIDCNCRKPKPGLLYQAARDLNIDLASSWLVGDGLTDIAAGKNGGTRTILLGRMKCELCFLMDDYGGRPDAVCANLGEAARFILRQEVGDGNLYRLSKNCGN